MDERVTSAGVVILILLLIGRFALAVPPLLVVALALLLGALILRRMGMGLRELVGRGAAAAEWRYMLKYMPAVMIASFGLGILSLLLLFHLAPEAMQGQLREMSRTYRGAGFVVLALVLAPVVEEILFRGMLFPLLALRWGAAAGMVVSALVFGLYHLNVLGASVFGLVATVLYMRTSSLLVPMGAHFVNNFLAIGLALLMPEPEEPQITPEDLRQGLWGALAMTALGGFFVLRLLRRNWPPSLPGAFRPFARD
jgi:uncharacterized protein